MNGYGLRVIPHFPCSCDCEKSLEIAKEYVNIGKKFGYSEEMNWLMEILSWPVQWSALHGIAEIKTPILKVSTKTDATSVKYTVKYVSDTYPDEGAKGLDFPYRISQSSKLTHSNSFQNGLNLIKTINLHSAQHQAPILFETWYYKDNGFGSRYSMDEAHKPVEKLAVTTLSKHYSLNVLDLGCGNGALLQKIRTICPKVTPYGIDSDTARIEHARILLPTASDNFVVGNLIEFDSLMPNHPHYALVMLAISRLEEMDSRQAIVFKELIQKYCDNLLVYDYWNRNLAEIALRVGIDLVSPAQNAKASIAKFSTKSEICGVEMRQSKSSEKTHNRESHNGLANVDYGNHRDLIHSDYSDHSDC